MPSPEILLKSATACVENAERLIDDAYCVEFQEPAATKLMLSMIAQEECAKAFLLLAVKDGGIPWSQYLLRATNDHACKQLVGVIMDFIILHWETEEELKALIREEFDSPSGFPTRVATALNIFRHGKLGKWESGGYGWDEDLQHDREALAIAEGKRDRVKQNALYVRLGKNAVVAGTPRQTAKEDIDREFELARRYLSLTKYMLEANAIYADRYHKTLEGFRLLFFQRIEHPPG